MVKFTQKIKDAFSKGFFMGTGFAVAVLTTSLLAVAITTFNAGDVLTATRLNELVNQLNTNTTDITALQGKGQIVVIPIFTITGPNATEYYGFQDGVAGLSLSSKQYAFSRNAVISNLKVLCSSNSINFAVTLVINNTGTNSSVSVTIPASMSGLFSSTGSVSFATGDKFAIEKTVAAGAMGAVNCFVDYLVQ